MIVMKKVSDISSEKNPHNVDARKIYETEHATAVVITLNPKESLKKHKTPLTYFFMFLREQVLWKLERRGRRHLRIQSLTVLQIFRTGG